MPSPILVIALLCGPLTAGPGGRTLPPPATTPVARGTIIRSGDPYMEIKFGVDIQRLRKLPGVPAQGKGAWALQQVVAGKVPSSLRIKALVDTSALRRRGILEDLLRRNWTQGSFRPEDPEVKAFLDFSGRLLNLGESFEYRFQDGRVWVRYQEEEWHAFKTPGLCSAVLKYNFSEEAANRDALEAFREAMDEVLR